MRARRLPPRRRDGGFSLPELMVSLVIALIALLAIGSVVATNDRFQRATIGTSDTQTTGALALYGIESDARMAGYGLLDNGTAPVVIEKEDGKFKKITFSFATPRTGQFVPGTLKEYFDPAPAVSRSYYVKDDQLHVVDPSGADVPIYDQIVDLRAEYGRDKNGDQRIDDNDNEWETDESAGQILAIRVGVLARSRDTERPESDGKCATTKDPEDPNKPKKPEWAGGKFTVPDPEIPPCYKYRVFETVIPLRNIIWREEP